MIIYEDRDFPFINITAFDILVILLVLVLVFFFARFKTNKYKTTAAYRYFQNALLIKLLFCLIYALSVMFFYPGDSYGYFKSINVFNKLLFQDFGQYFDILFLGNKPEFFSYFNSATGYPFHYMWRDPAATFVARFYTPFMIFSHNSYILSSIIAGLIGFTGIWKLYKTLCKIYPGIEKQLAIAVLYFPSLIYWSSGILKDTLTISAIGWIIYAFYEFFILKSFKLKYVLYLFIASTVIIQIKAYIFAALLPGLFIWVFFRQIKTIKSQVLKILIAPIILLVLVFAFSFLMNKVSKSMGDYSDLDSSLKRAQIIQQDLIRSEQYGHNFYDIGKFETTPLGVLKMFPKATISGIFRPFVWEARNLFVLLAAFESLFLLLFTFYIFFKTGFIKLSKTIFSAPFLIFSLFFIIIFGFGIGLASANFGALVRYKIPLLPFYMASLFIIRHLNFINLKKDD